MTNHSERIKALVREAQSQLVSHAKLADKKAAALGYPRQDVSTVIIFCLLRTWLPNIGSPIIQMFSIEHVNV